MAISVMGINALKKKKKKIPASPDNRAAFDGVCAHKMCVCVRIFWQGLGDLKAEVVLASRYILQLHR